MSVQVPEPAATDFGLVALLAYAAQSANGVGARVAIAAPCAYLAFELVCALVAGGAGPTLDVWVQQSWDGGYNWDDVVHFPQVVGVPGTFIATVPVRQEAVAGEVHQAQDAALGAGAVKSVTLARDFRVKWTMAGGGTFSFQVLAAPRQAR